ncbi:MAG: esterase-like activity of phytase family protein [Paracoccaceae bacterium]|nr:esterase-like activity of phytase family protein [Paracoccaceae bacterium]
MRRRSGRALAAALIWLSTASAGPTDDLRYLGTTFWQVDDPNFGGFSGLELSADGTQFTALTDRGHVVSGTLTREGERITSISAGTLTPLRNPQGKVLPRALNDAEGLAIGPQGRTYVSFEGRHRVWAYDNQGRPTPLPRPKAFRRLQPNSGLEALAINAEGHLYVLPERSGALQRPFPIWRFDGRNWRHVYDVPRSGGFLPVGADFGPDGRLYLLERAFTGFAFRSRVRVLMLGPKRTVTSETLLTTPSWRHDNLEGLSVWKDAKNRIRLTMISDDNFRMIQRTQFVEYVITAPLASSRRRP